MRGPWPLRIKGPELGRTSRWGVLTPSLIPSMCAWYGLGVQMESVGDGKVLRGEVDMVGWWEVRIQRTNEGGGSWP